MPDLSGRVALVTGASKGIGKAIALRLAKAGARVVICARDPERLELTAREIRDSGGSVLAVPVDVTAGGAVQTAVERATKETRGIDILVNNVGGAIRFGGLSDLSNDDWANAFQLNVMSMVHFVNASLPWLRQSRNARIITISSIAGVEPGLFNPHYTTTKAATINFSKVLANSLAKERILCNVVCPGTVRTDAWDKNIDETARREGITREAAAALVEKQEAAKIPLGRIGESDEIAGLVAFLASDDARWITGSCFHVNGGKTRSI